MVSTECAGNAHSKSNHAVSRTQANACRTKRLCEGHEFTRAVNYRKGCGLHPRRKKLLDVFRCLILSPLGDHAPTLNLRGVPDPKNFSALCLDRENASHLSFSYVVVEHWRNVGAGRETHVINSHLEEFFAGIAEKSAGTFVDFDISAFGINFYNGRRDDREHT